MRDQKEYDRLYYQRNKAKRDAQAKAWQIANADKLNAISREKYSENREDPAFLEAKALQQREYSATPKGAFANHKQSSQSRGIGFELTFDEWWSVWEPCWESRRDGQYLVMARTRDEGAYALGNVRITTQSDNIREWHELRREQEHG